MSFFKDDEWDERSKDKQMPRKVLYSGIIGLIIGATLFAFAVPTLTRIGWIQEKGKTEASDTPNIAAAPPKQNNSNTVDLRSGFVDAVDKASDAVVGVLNIQRDSFSESDAEAGTGSGVIYKKENGKAFIATNHHVVAGANRLEVSLSDGNKIPAELLGSDIVMDLAVLQIDEKYASKVIEMGDSNSVRRGEPAIAIGNPLGLEFSGTVTQGIISATERIVPVDLDNDGHYDWQVEVLQTDAAINPGNSGGALINANGKLVGINSMKIAAKSVEGIGLAIPVSRAIPIIDELQKTGKVQRPYLGVELRSLEEIPNYYWQKTMQLPQNVTSGVCVLDVKSPSPAAQAGMKEYDVIVELDGQPIHNMLEFRTLLYKKKIGDKMSLSFYRGTKKEAVTVTLTSMGY